MDQNSLGPAERLINAILAYNDHGVHNRPGMVVPDTTSVVGVRWFPVTHKEENGVKMVYRLDKVGKKNTQTFVGVLKEDMTVRNPPNRTLGIYRPAGLFPEVITWMYKQVAEIYKLDNEFVAHWASYAFNQEHRDLKCVLAAFLLVQSRKGDPIRDGDKVLFTDDDYRDVGEAMMLIQKKDKDLNPKLLMRLHSILTLPEVAKINRDLGFGHSNRNPFLGRWPRAVEKWLNHRTDNPQLLVGLVKAGFRTTVMQLARIVGYKPESPKFFEILRWKQKQASDGRRNIAIGQAVSKAESWDGLSEKQICEMIVKTKPGFKRIVGLLPKGQGLTKAIVACAIDNKCLSDKDIIISSATLEDLGLLEHPAIRPIWESALKKADDMRAANIAQRMKSTKNQEVLVEAADKALQTQVQEVMKDMRVYVLIDISGSMEISIRTAKTYLAKFLQAFPADKLHVATFNTMGKIVEIKHPSAAGVEQAFSKISAGGGTSHGAGVREISKLKPKDNEDVLMIFVGDEEEGGTFDPIVTASGLRPMAFGLLKVGGSPQFRIVSETAARLKIPCITIDEKIFTDPYAAPRTIRNLVASTPVGSVSTGYSPQAALRQSLVDIIMKTPLLTKPVWS